MPDGSSDSKLCLENKGNCSGATGCVNCSLTCAILSLISCTLLALRLPTSELTYLLSADSILSALYSSVCRLLSSCCKLCREKVGDTNGGPVSKNMSFLFISSNCALDNFVSFPLILKNSENKLSFLAGILNNFLIDSVNLSHKVFCVPLYGILSIKSCVYLLVNPTAKVSCICAAA